MVILALESEMGQLTALSFQCSTQLRAESIPRLLCTMSLLTATAPISWDGDVCLLTALLRIYALNCASTGQKQSQSTKYRGLVCPALNAQKLGKSLISAHHVQDRAAKSAYPHPYPQTLWTHDRPELNRGTAIRLIMCQLLLQQKLGHVPGKRMSGAWQEGIHQVEKCSLACTS